MRSVFYLLAAILALSVSWYYYQSVSQQNATVSKLRLVAEEGLIIKAGTRIDGDFIDRYIVSQPIPLALSRDFAWALDDNAIARANIEGWLFAQDVAGGNFLQAEHLQLELEQEFERRIKAGNRAFSIPVQSEHTLESLIQPGSRVDVIGTFDTPDRNYFSKMLLENVEVMAVGETVTRGASGEGGAETYNSVTLQASVEIVETFLGEFESADGALTLVLRNPCDENPDCVGASQ